MKATSHITQCNEHDIIAYSQLEILQVSPQASTVRAQVDLHVIGCMSVHECPYDGSEIQHKACIVRLAVFQMQCIVTLSLPKPASGLVRMPRESALGLAVRMIPFCPTSNHFALSYSPPFLDMSFLLLHSFDLRMP